MTTGRPDPSPESLRDPRFDAAWRAASREEPSAALDAAVLAAARRAVGAGPQPAAVPEATRPERWWWPLAAAASIGAVAIGILQLVEHERAGAPDPVRAIVSDTPSATTSSAPAASQTSPTPPAPPAAPSVAAPPAAKPEAPAATPPKPGRNDAAREDFARLRKEADVAQPGDDRRAPGPVAADVAVPGPAAKLSSSAPPAPPAPPAPKQEAPHLPAAPSRDAASSAREAQPFPGGAAVPRPAESDRAQPAALGKVMPAPAAGARADERARSAAPLPVAEWIALIRKLRAEGRTEELAREVAAFRAAYPEQQQRLDDALSAGGERPATPAR